MRALLSHRLVPVVAMAAIVILLPLFFSSAYYYRVAALVFVFALASIGLNLLMGFAGQVSLGHAGFMGIGAYAVAIGPTHLGVASWLSFVIGAALSALVAFVVSAIYASVAGSYLALLNGHITPDVSGFLRSIELVAMVVLGGMGSIAGSLVGAALLVVLPQTLTFLHDYEHIALGLIVMAVMVFLRAGIVPTLARALDLRRA